MNVKKQKKMERCIILCTIIFLFMLTFSGCGAKNKIIWNYNKEEKSIDIINLSEDDIIVDVEISIEGQPINEKDLLQASEEMSVGGIDDVNEITNVDINATYLSNMLNADVAILVSLIFEIVAFLVGFLVGKSM